MNVVVMDLELNQPSNKIIQIGAVSVNLKRAELKADFSMICNPGESPSQEIVDLTGITVEQVETAPPFQEVASHFWGWLKDCCVGGHVMAWGSDFYELKRQSEARGIYPQSKLRVLNFKEMFKWFLYAKTGSYKGGLSASLKTFGMKFEGRPHQARDDAWNTARLAFKAYDMISTHLAAEKLYTKRIP